MSEYYLHARMGPSVRGTAVLLSPLRKGPYGVRPLATPKFWRRGISLYEEGEDAASFSLAVNNEFDSHPGTQTQTSAEAAGRSTAI